MIEQQIDRDRLRTGAESALACGTFDGEVTGAVAPLLDQLTRAEAQSEVRRLDITYWRERAQEFEERIKAVRGLHIPVKLKEHTGTSWHSAPDDHLVCVHCTDPDGGGYDSYPCETLRALDGEG